MSRLKEAYSTCMECGGKMKSGGWISKAIKKPGSFTKQAKAAGMSVPAFRNKVLANKGDYSTTTVRRANLAKTLSKMRKGEDGMDVNNKPTSLTPLSPAAQQVVRAANPLTAPLPDLSARSQVVEDLGLRKKPAPGLAKGGSEKVAAYQRMLRDKGFKVTVDGAWGKETQAAYEQFIKSTSRKPDMRPSRADLPENRSYYSKIKNAPTSTGKGWYTPEQWDQATARNNAMENGLPSVSLPSSKGIIRRKMAMGGSIPGVNGSVIGPVVNTAKAGQSFPKKNAGTKRSLKSYRK